MEIEIKYDYDALDVQTAEVLKEKEFAIKARTSRTIIENGRDLIEAKAACKHGEFQNWVERCFSMSYRQARRMMQVSEEFKSDQLVTFENLSNATIFLLSAPSTPESARKEAIEKAENGEKVTTKEAKALIEAHQEIERQQNFIDDLENEIVTLESQLPTQDVKEQIQELKKQLEDVQNKKQYDLQKKAELLNEQEKKTQKLKKEIRKIKRDYDERISKLLVEKKPLPKKKYKTIIIDPPWPMQKILRESTPNQNEFDYPVMSIDEITDMPIYAVADQTCHLFMWTTHRFLPDALRILKGWGFKYIFTMVWHKSGGFQPFNLPQYNCEFVVYGRIGKAEFVTTKQFPTSFDGERREHSRKPEKFYDIIKNVTPLPRFDMFAREQRIGFDTFGDEEGKF